MRIRQIVPFVRAWFRSRYRPQDYRAACGHCPHWIEQGRVTRDYYPAGDDAKHTITMRVGVCARATAHIFNDFTTGFGLKAWTADDWCSLHPLYQKRRQGSNLEYDPAALGTVKYGGFSRTPSFAEALKFAQVPDEDGRPMAGEESLGRAIAEFGLALDNASLKPQGWQEPSNKPVSTADQPKKEPQ